MTSLFSSFDYFEFFSSSVFSFFFFLVLMNSLYKISMVNLLFYSLYSYLENFYLSLKPKSFTKSFIFSLIGLFFLIFFINVNSVFSFIFPISSQLSFVLFFSLSLWLSFTFFSLLNNFKGFISHFTPSGTPFALVPFLFLIELVSSIIRPITLMVRLCANILAGHLLMILLSNLVFSYSTSFIPYLILNTVELFVGLIQSYIYCTMICLYFSEVE